MYPLKAPSSKCEFSIIIPVLDEIDNILSIIENLYALRSEQPFEIIVVDGDPNGETIKFITHKGIRQILSSPGRAHQMNAGAAIASGEILIFLHADTKLPIDALQNISSVMEGSKYVGGAFSLGIDSERLIFRIIAYLASLRSLLTRVPYGDQAIFIRSDYFHKVGGYMDIPLMEDIELMRRIKKLGDKIYIFPYRVKTSPRRWEKEGVVYCTLRNRILSGLFLLGVPSFKLARFYRSSSDTYTE